jgi:hypothetical protein
VDAVGIHFGSWRLGFSWDLDPGVWSFVGPCRSVAKAPSRSLLLNSQRTSPQKYSVDFQRLTPIRKNIFQPPPTFFGLKKANFPRNSGAPMIPKPGGNTDFVDTPVCCSWTHRQKMAQWACMKLMLVHESSTEALPGGHLVHRTVHHRLISLAQSPRNLLARLNGCVHLEPPFACSTNFESERGIRPAAGSLTFSTKQS